MTTPLEWVSQRNRAWREALRNASLVIELDIDDDEMETSIEYLGGLLRNNSGADVRRRFPAFLVASLTSAGMLAFEEGTFYAKVAALTGAGKPAVESAAREFRTALNILGLPTFAEAGGMAWVTPVLLHGGIPLDHLDELMDVVASRRRRDSSVDGEDVVLWARTVPGALAGQPRALTRFIEYGGDFAPDYVGRIVDHLDGEDASLPRRVVERLDALVEAGHTHSRRVRQARAVVALDREGVPVLRLPPTKPRDGREVRWRVSFDGNVQHMALRVPYGQSTTVTPGGSIPLPGPTRSVTVEHEGSSRTQVLVRKDDPLLVFDSRHEFVPPAAPLMPGPATLMWPATRQSPVDGDGSALRGRRLQVPFGWEGWEALQLDLVPGQSVALQSMLPRRVRQDERARLEGGSFVDNVLSSDGLPVLGETPRLLLPTSTDPASWLITVSADDGSILDRFTPDGWDVDPFRSFERPVEGAMTVMVRGPLGRGMTRRLAIWQGANATIEPGFRGFTEGGLAPSQVSIRTMRGADTFSLGPRDVAQQVTTSAGTTFSIEPPRAGFALARAGEAPMWRIGATRLTTEDLPEHTVWLRTHPATENARLILESAGQTQVVPLTDAGRGSYRCDLARFADTARESGVGTVWFTAEVQPRVPLVLFRPRQLARGVVLVGQRLEIDSDIEAGLEAVLHRSLAPWEEGRIVRIENGAATLPTDLLHGGPLRVTVRAVNEWAPELPGPYPHPGPDVFDLSDVPIALEAESHPGLTAFILNPTDMPSLGVGGIALVLELLATGIRLPRPLATPANLSELARHHPREFVNAILRSDCSSAELVRSLVASSLVAHPVVDMADPDLLEPLLTRSPLAAQLVASAALVNDPSSAIIDVMAATLGEEYSQLARGEATWNARVGRFEPAFSAHPEIVAGLYAALDPVPNLVLDLDTRVAAAHELWQARHRLAAPARVALPGASKALQALTATPGLRPLVTERSTHDGVLALPVLTISLAILARLAAHGDDDAAAVYERYRGHHRSLAHHAPSFTEIDLIRADIAIIGARA